MKIEHDDENYAVSYLAAGCVIEKDNKYLLVQEKQKKVFGQWNLPAGRVDFGDSFEKTAVKEAKEETGYDVEIIKKIDIFQDRVDQPAKHAYLAKIVGGSLSFPDDEILDAKWFTYDEVSAMKDKLRDDWVIRSIELVR